MKKSHRVRILIADEYLLVAEACKNLLEPEFEVVGIASDGPALLQMASKLRPDIVILDISMPKVNGLDAGAKIKQEMHSIKLIYLTVMGPDVAAEAFRRGASGYILRNCKADELIAAVRSVASGDTYLSPLIARETVECLFRSCAEHQQEKKISTRQRDILQLLAEGKTLKEIAYFLELKPTTIAFHKHKLMDALGIRTKAGLVVYAVKRHMTSQLARTDPKTPTGLLSTSSFPRLQ